VVNAVVIAVVIAAGLVANAAGLVASEANAAVAVATWGE
jgi:hypothetical protein